MCGGGRGSLGMLRCSQAGRIGAACALSTAGRLRGWPFVIATVLVAMTSVLQADKCGHVRPAMHSCTMHCQVLADNVGCLTELAGATPLRVMRTCGSLETGLLAEHIRRAWKESPTKRPCMR